MLPELKGHIAHVVMRIMETLAYRLACVSTVSPVNRVTCYGQQHVRILHSKTQVVPNTVMDIDNAHLKACNDSGYWCCESDANVLTTQQCCDSSFKLTQPVGTVIAQLQSGVGAIPLATASSLPSNSANSNSTDNSDSIPSGAVAGLAIEGVIMVFALAGAGFMFWRNRLLSKKVLEAEAATIAARAQQQQQQQQQAQYQWQPPPSSHGTMHHSGAWGYSSPVETEPKRSELQGPALGTYTELPGGDVIGTELSSEPRTPKTPGSPFHQP
ncbi:hypothetical protein ABKA04_008071 [Annulohypoxylon sp. FPYF3050]